MDKRIFITPGDTGLGAALAEKASMAGWAVATTSKEDGTAPGREENPLIIACKGRSFLSIRKSFIDSLNALGGIDVALLLHEAHQEERPVHELTPAAMEEYIDIRMKNLFFILREILSLFVRQRSGILAMVNYIPEDLTLLPLCAAAAAAFRAVADSLATLYQNESIVINGFDCINETPERYSRFILDLLSGKAAQTSGKWYRCGGTGRLSRPRILRK